MNNDRSELGGSQQLGVPWEYENTRGIKVEDAGWECPNCGDSGRKMYRPGSKDTCATCFYVVDGRNNDVVLDDFRLGYREAQQLLSMEGEDWHGTPGDVANRLRRVFASPKRARQKYDRYLGGDE